jgi:hypothetical protein
MKEEMKSIIYLGDIHGNFKWLKSEIERKKIGDNLDATYLIQVGDFGIGFNNKSDLETLENLNEFCAIKNLVLITTRGNHDDPAFFQGNHMYSNLMLVTDYTVMDIYGKNHLFVGGAVSIDRKYRSGQDYQRACYGSSQKSYWSDEVFILDEEKLKDIYGINVVVTHSAPEWCYPDNINGFGDLVDEYAFYDKQLYDDLKTERANITKMFKILENNGNAISEHYYGHFHSSQITMNGYCNHYLLGINEFR